MAAKKCIRAISVQHSMQFWERLNFPSISLHSVKAAERLAAWLAQFPTGLSLPFEDVVLFVDVPWDRACPALAALLGRCRPHTLKVVSDTQRGDSILQLLPPDARGTLRSLRLNFDSHDSDHRFELLHTLPNLDDLSISLGTGGLVAQQFAPAGPLPPSITFLHLKAARLDASILSCERVGHRAGRRAWTPSPLCRAALYSVAVPQSRNSSFAHCCRHQWFGGSVLGAFRSGERSCVAGPAAAVPACLLQRLPATSS